MYVDLHSRCKGWFMYYTTEKLCFSTVTATLWMCCYWQWVKKRCLLTMSSWCYCTLKNQMKGHIFPGSMFPFRPIDESADRLTGCPASAFSRCSCAVEIFYALVSNHKLRCWFHLVEFFFKVLLIEVESLKHTHASVSLWEVLGIYNDTGAAQHKYTKRQTEPKWKLQNLNMRGVNIKKMF